MAGLGTFLLAFLASYLGTLALLKVRVKDRFVDVPGERSSHDVVKPRLGGIAIVASFLLGFGFLAATHHEVGRFFPLLAGGALIFVVGVLDDRRSLPVFFRLAAQLGATIIVVGTGNVVDHIYVPLVGVIDLDVLSIPFTILFVLASINFYNFIDGIDGLAAGSACIVSGFLALIAYMLGHGALALVCLAITGGALGFLQFNFPPSRLFMGDSGSTFLGFFFAFVAISGNRLVPEVPFFVTILLLSSLYLDAGVTLLGRFFRGEQIFRPHRTHYYQRLLALGFNHKQVTVLEYGLTVLLGASAVIFFRAGGFFPIFLCLCWIVIFTSLMLKVRGLERGDRLFWERRTVLVVASDILLVALAYYAAFFLRLGFQTSSPHWEAVVRAFPIVLLVRSSCFYWYGLYRGVWKYTSTPDVVRIIKAVTVGSAVVLMLLVFFYRFEAFPRSMFVMEYFLLIIGLAGTRFASRLFHEFGKEATVGDARRVAILGAGDSGEQLLREVRSSEGKRASVVCFIDDDKEKDGLTVQGVPITGPTDRLVEICLQYGVDTVLVGNDGPGDTRLQSVVRSAGDAGIRVDTRGGEVYDELEPSVVLFDRLSRGLKRTLPSQPSETARRFFRDKRVLVTHGGEALGPALARELIGLGGHVTVHVASERDKERFSGCEGECLTCWIGRVDRESEAAGVLEAASPHVVVHAVTLRATGAVNEAEYVWRRSVRTSEAWCRVLETSTVDSVVFAVFWEDVRPGDDRGLMAAASEALVLNHPGIIRVSPKIVRLPSVLTEERLRHVVRSRPGEPSGPERYGLLESEAVAVLLNTAAMHGGRALVIPSVTGSFGPKDVARILTRGTARQPEPGDAALPTELRPLFPGETPRPSVIAGANELVSPLYPASETLERAVSACLHAVGAERVAECLGGVATELFSGAEASSGSMRPSVD